MPSQRRREHQAYRANAESWQRFTALATTQVQEFLHQAQASADDLIPELHRVAIKCYQQFFHMKRIQFQPHRSHKLIWA